MVKFVDMSVEYVDHMGSDLSVVNAARVSFHKQSDSLVDKDEKLIAYLAKHNHWTPFGHASLSLRVKAPIFVARQLGKHQVGLVWNEVSRRYVDEEPEFYRPDSWRARADNVKQGSSETEVVSLPLTGSCENCGEPVVTYRECEAAVKRFCSTKCQWDSYRSTETGWAIVKAARLKQSAIKRGFEFSLTKDDLLPRPSHCKYLRIELNYSAKTVAPNSPSVNRIDPTKGYIPGNIEIISNKANIMLSNASEEELDTFIKQYLALKKGVFVQSAPTFETYLDRVREAYLRMIEAGVCPEQARMILPQNTMTEWVWTGSLAAWGRVLKLRLDPHTQKETRDVAALILPIVEQHFPISTKALLA